MRIKEKIDEWCDACGSQVGIFYIYGGLEKFCSDELCAKSFGKLERLPNSQFRMPFGKHKDKLISELPVDYIQWGACNLVKTMAKRFQEELRNREKS